MALTPATFRATLPEFTDPDTYPDAQVQLFLTLAGTFQNAFRWDAAALDYGASLFTAHSLVLQARETATSAAGGIPGTVQGVRTSKTVDKVTVAYDAEAVTQKDGSWWNMTTYGIRFLQLTRAYGTGGFQVGAGPAGQFSFGGGWPGCW